MLFLVYYLVQQAKTPKLSARNNLVAYTEPPNLRAAKITGLQYINLCLPLTLYYRSHDNFWGHGHLLDTPLLYATHRFTVRILSRCQSLSPLFRNVQFATILQRKHSELDRISESLTHTETHCLLSVMLSAHVEQK